MRDIDHSQRHKGIKEGRNVLIGKEVDDFLVDEAKELWMEHTTLTIGYSGRIWSSEDIAHLKDAIITVVSGDDDGYLGWSWIASVVGRSREACKVYAQKKFGLTLSKVNAIFGSNSSELSQIVGEDLAVMEKEEKEYLFELLLGKVNTVSDQEIAKALNDLKSAATSKVWVNMNPEEKERIKNAFHHGPAYLTDDQREMWYERRQLNSLLGRNGTTPVRILMIDLSSIIPSWDSPVLVALQGYEQRT